VFTLTFPRVFQLKVSILNFDQGFDNFYVFFPKKFIGKNDSEGTYLVIWGQKIKLHTQNFEIRNPTLFMSN
jgi:hypothetical protein